MDPNAFGLLTRAFFALCKKADTPVSLSMWLMFSNGEFEQLVKKDIDPLQYTDEEVFSRDYAVVKYLSKYKGFSTGIDLDQVALDAWRQAEGQCQETNQRIRSSRLRGSSPRVEAVLFTAQRKISGVLGSLKLTSAFDGCKWGPGATLSLKGEKATLEDKVREYPIQVTPRALPYIKAVVESDPHWAEVIINSGKPEHDEYARVEGPFTLLPCCFTTVPGCRATLVDKSAKTKRAIAIEPTGNIFLQLGVGNYIRKRLQRVGVDLDDQTWNQALAYYGSITGDVATIDLKAASDTVSREVVFQLLPLDWSILLDQLRSPKILWKGEPWLQLEKFSSMGNGFTFELESLIFWGITSAVVEVLETEELIGIYGDDIICRQECVPLLREVLDYCGFTVNSEKSHDRGYFRESCGRHYWNGSDVTPPYQKEVPDSLPELYRFCNRLLRYYRNSGADLQIRYRSWVVGAWRSSVEFLADFLAKPRGLLWRKLDFGLGEDNVFPFLAFIKGHAIPLWDVCDDGLMLPFRWLQFFFVDHNENGGWKLPVLSFQPKSRKANGWCLLTYWLRFWPETPLKGRVTVRRRGQYKSRRRWFYNSAYVSDLSILDVVPA